MSAEVWISAGAIACLLTISGFFSGSETALSRAARARLHAAEKEGDARASRVNKLVQEPDQLIGAILLGNNLVNILAASLMTVAFSPLGAWGPAVATVVMTTLVLIFAEVLPKTYAFSNADRMAMAVSAPIMLIVRLFAPIVMVVRAIVRATLGLFGVRAEHIDEFDSYEEIRGAIDLHHQDGGVEKRDRDMLGSILDLSDLTVSDVMVHRKGMEMIDIDAPPDEAIDAALSSRHTRIPLFRDDPDNIVGVVHAKDLSRALHRNEGGGGVKLETIARDPWFVPETTSLPEQLNAFRAKREHFALVVDEYGALMGLVTLEDILEEIVGQIDDEHDAPVEGVRPQPDGSVVVNGSVSIRDLNRAMDWELPDDEAVTVAGLVIHEAQTIPEAGQVFSFHGRRFEIVRKVRNQLTQLRVSAAPKIAEGASEQDIVVRP